MVALRTRAAVEGVPARVVSTMTAITGTTESVTISARWSQAQRARRRGASAAGTNRVAREPLWASSLRQTSSSGGGGHSGTGFSARRRSSRSVICLPPTTLLRSVRVGRSLPGLRPASERTVQPHRQRRARALQCHRGAGRLQALPSNQQQHPRSRLQAPTAHAEAGASKISHSGARAYSGEVARISALPSPRPSTLVRDDPTSARQQPRQGGRQEPRPAAGRRQRTPR